MNIMIGHKRKWEKESKIVLLNLIRTKKKKKEKVKVPGCLIDLLLGRLQSNQGPNQTEKRKS